MLKKDKSAKDGFRAPRTGEIMKNPTLSNTFKLLAENGKKGFYEGPVAESIIKVTTDLGGHLTAADLKHHGAIGSEATKPLCLRFTAFGANRSRGGLDVWEHPPNGQGIVALMALGILQSLWASSRIPAQWSTHDHNSPSHLHATIESLRLAFADANWFVTDPSVRTVPTASLISTAYLSARASLFNPTSALPPSLAHGSPAHSSSDTVYFAVSDAAGNACSFINSNYAGFGTCIVPRGTGFSLQNRGANFSLEGNHPNAYAPRKRPYHTIIPGMATHVDDGSLALAFGVMGGFMQPQGHVQVLLNRYVFGMDVQEALDAPRFCIGEGMPGEGGEVGAQVVYVEEGMAEETVRGLRKLGHRVEVVTGYGRALFGRGQIIERVDDGGDLVWRAGSDGRADGAAVPLV
jgi:gamma-glutamyltranspeptidase/glutathione hydrolase